MSTCAACGQENPPGFRFCGACGAPLPEQAETVQEERKIVTVLFADLVGFTGRAEQLDPEDVQALLSPYHARLRTELERFGGTVEKFIGDAVMALFGAPTAHEDDPERAVRAGLAIRDALAEVDAEDPGLRLQVRVGIATGEALVRLAARPHEGEGMAAGDVVNTAARLQAAASVNGVLVGEGTYRATARAIEYRPAEPVMAKGKAEPLLVWEALHARARYGMDVVQRSRAALVGRQDELALLADALGRVRRERAPQLVTVVGVPGIGKSRLVWELFGAVEAEPEIVYWRQGRCLPYGEGVAFWALGEMVKAHAGVFETDGGEEAQAKVRCSVQDLVHDPGEAQWVESHLRPLLGLGGETELGGDRRSEVFSAWRRFFEALAEQRPLVLVFEDLHWADDGLLDFVDHLVDWAGDVPILAVGTARPELLERRPGWGGGKRNATTVSLSPLSEEETARLLSTLLERAVLPAELQTLLLARAGGNPLYAEEFARMLADRGVGASEEVPLPESVQGVIAARLDLLGPEEKALLQDAAVVGKVFWLGALSVVDELPRWTVEERLHALERKEFIRRERRSQVSGETEYAFRHVLVRDVAYGQIPRARRADKHRAVAEWIGQLAPDRAEDHAEMLAHHYLSALEFARAAGQATESLAEPARLALRDAGDRALSLNAFPSARRFYEAALELWEDEDPERGQLLLRYGKARYHIGPANLEVLAEARGLLLAADEPEAAAEADVMLGLLLWHRGESDRAREHFGSALALVADTGLSPSKGYVLAAASRSLMVGGQSEQAIRVAREALAIADELGLDEIRANALNNMGVARAQRGDPAGREDLERSIAIALEANSPESIRGYVNLADVLERFGELERAFELRQEGAQAADRFGDVFRIRWFRGERVNEDYWRGRWDAAFAGATAFIEEVEAGSPHYLESLCREARGRINAARGDLRAALADSHSDIEFARGAKDAQILLPALAGRARLLVGAGRLDEAEKLAAEVLASSENLPASWLIDLAVVLRALDRGDELPEWAARVKAGTPWLSAAVAFATGDFLRSAEIYAGIGSLPDEALARLHAAEQLIAEHRRAEGDAELQRALTFYRSVDARTYVGRGETLLAASA